MSHVRLDESASQLLSHTNKSITQLHATSRELIINGDERLSDRKASHGED